MQPAQTPDRTRALPTSSPPPPAVVPALQTNISPEFILFFQCSAEARRLLAWQGGLGPGADPRAPA